MTDQVRRSMFPGLFGPNPAGKPAPAPKKVHTPGHCFCCNHPKSKHCASAVKHGRWRTAPGVKPPPGSTFTCETMHCEETLCSCTNFAATRADLCRFQRAYEDK